jgi:glycosyltransferase involved in cell wall biosynthesis
MRGLPEHEFASLLQDSFVSVWIDDISSFGTFPLESMTTGTPVIGKIPNIKPSWMNEKNGIWVNDTLSMVDILAEYIQNWLEDNISETLYESGYETVSEFLNSEKFENETLNIFGEYINKRLESFKQQLEKIKEQ